MRVEIPKNVYTAILGLMLPDPNRNEIQANSSSLITQNLEAEKADIGLIPSLDLIKHKDLYVSRRVAVSFDGILSNAYFYFVPDQQDFDEIFLQGDVSSNEIILSSILFKERFNKEVKITLDKQPLDFANKNYCIVGNANLDEALFNNGVSFADQIAALIEYPYTNFVLASKSEEKLKNFVSNIGEIDKLIEDKISEILDNVQFNPKAKQFIRNNLNTVYYEMTENEVNGLNELLKLPYFYEITDDIVEIKFAD
jgi:hypothetical protein